MKKIITLVLILFTINCVGQDTTYFRQREELYMSIRTKITDTTIQRKYLPDLKKQRRRDNIFILSVASFFTAATIWYFK